MAFAVRDGQAGGPTVIRDAIAPVFRSRASTSELNRWRKDSQSAGYRFFAPGRWQLRSGSIYSRLQPTLDSITLTLL